MLTDIVADQVDVVTRGFLGLTVACARCHDHKFDPISADDYYGLAGIFFSTRILPDPGPKTAGSPMLRTHDRHPGRCSGRVRGRRSQNLAAGPGGVGEGPRPRRARPIARGLLPRLREIVQAAGSASEDSFGRPPRFRRPQLGRAAWRGDSGRRLATVRWRDVEGPRRGALLGEPSRACPGSASTRPPRSRSSLGTLTLPGRTRSTSTPGRESPAAIRWRSRRSPGVVRHRGRGSPNAEPQLRRRRDLRPLDSPRRGRLAGAGRGLRWTTARAGLVSRSSGSRSSAGDVVELVVTPRGGVQPATPRPSGSS